MNRVLILERDPVALNTITVLLDSLGIRYDIMRSWDLEQLLAFFPAYQAVLVSVETPQLDIQELLMLFDSPDRPEPEETSVILMSRPQSEKLLASIQKHRHQVVLQKPIESETLYRTLVNFTQLDMTEPVGERQWKLLEGHRLFLNDLQNWFVALEQISKIQ